MDIAMISSYPPRMCGVATFAWHMRQALIASGEFNVPVVTMVRNPEDAPTAPEVLARVRHNRHHDYLAAARALNKAPVQLVVLQHEFGLFGGKDGAKILTLLSALRKPVITIFHSVNGLPGYTTPHRTAILREIAARSLRCVALSRRDQTLLSSLYGADPQKTAFIPPGAPPEPDGSPEEWKARLGLSGRSVMMTFGLLGPGKGYDTVMQAVARVAPAHPDLLYLLVGRVHPGLGDAEAVAFRQRITALTDQLGISHHVRFLRQYLPEDQLLSYLKACDLYVIPYLNQDQGVSATLTYAACLGKPVLSTPFPHAQELLDGDAGYLFPFGDADRLAEGIRELLDSKAKRQQLSEAILSRTGEFRWPLIAKRYRDLLRTALQESGLPVTDAPGRSDPPSPPPEAPGPSGFPWAELSCHPDRLRIQPRRAAKLYLRIRNIGTTDWLPGRDSIEAVADLLTPARKLVRENFWRHPLDQTVRAGEEVTVAIGVQAPGQPGSYRMRIDLQHRSWGRLTDHGLEPLLLPLIALVE